MDFATSFTPRGLVALFLVLGLYVLPSMIAVGRHCNRPGAVVLVNLFFGWTIAGWFVALVMALTFSRQPL